MLSTEANELPKGADLDIEVQIVDEDCVPVPLTSLEDVEFLLYQDRSNVLKTIPLSEMIEVNVLQGIVRIIVLGNDPEVEFICGTKIFCEFVIKITDANYDSGYRTIVKTGIYLTTSVKSVNEN